MNRADLIKKINEIEGLTSDERSSLLALLRSHKKYGLVWEDKPEDVEERLREELPVLREVPEKRIINDNSDAPNHIIIEEYTPMVREAAKQPRASVVEMEQRKMNRAAEKNDSKYYNEQ